MKVEENDALLVIDVQNDFCPGGALPVGGGDAAVPAINGVMERFRHLVFSRDWHPCGHCSFADPPAFQDGSWPAHCIQHSPGAEFHGDLRVPLDAHVVSKGADPDAEAYSAFDSTELAAWLRERGVTRVFAAGLATDYCVKSTVLDALEEGFEAVVIEDGCRGVADDTTAAAWETMRRAGAVFVRSGALL